MYVYSPEFRLYTVLPESEFLSFLDASEFPSLVGKGLEHVYNRCLGKPNTQCSHFVLAVEVSRSRNVLSLVLGIDLQVCFVVVCSLDGEGAGRNSLVQFRFHKSHLHTSEKGSIFFLIASLRWVTK